MGGRKLQAAALVLTVFSALLFLPPIILPFATEARLFGMPLGVVYIFLAWIVVIAAAGVLAKRLRSDSRRREDG